MPPGTCHPRRGPENTWSAISAALVKGNRGLPGGSSLARLMMNERGKRARTLAPRLTLKQIPTRRIIRSVVVMVVARIGSLHGLVQTRPSAKPPRLGPRTPSNQPPESAPSKSSPNRLIRRDSQPGCGIAAGGRLAKPGRSAEHGAGRRGRL